MPTDTSTSLQDSPIMAPPYTWLYCRYDVSCLGPGDGEEGSVEPYVHDTVRFRMRRASHLPIPRIGELYQHPLLPCTLEDSPRVADIAYFESWGTFFGLDDNPAGCAITIVLTTIKGPVCVSRAEAGAELERIKTLMSNRGWEAVPHT